MAELGVDLGQGFYFGQPTEKPMAVDTRLVRPAPDQRAAHRVRAGSLASAHMAQERDLFANFERMRREMDELFGDVLDRGLAPRRRGGFSPAVDVYYASDPPRAVVRADLAGIDPDAVSLEITGRELVLSGQRETESADDRVYQQLEIERGPFRRVVSLGAEVDAESADATYEDGILTVELPLSRPTRPRTVPIRGTDR